MINYSIVMRSVNANLFDINQAKSRIKAAEKAGQTPSPEDVALVATEKQNAFATAAKPPQIGLRWIRRSRHCAALQAACTSAGTSAQRS